MGDIIPGVGEWDAWNAAVIEKLLRDGHHIYFEDTEGPHGRAEFNSGLFQFIRDPRYAETEGDILAKETDSFLEFAVWCAFMGRDFL